MGKYLAAVCLILLASCGGTEKKPQPLTERQRDSAIGESRIPGAQGVKGAMKVADSAKARRAIEDSISQ